MILRPRQVDFVRRCTKALKKHNNALAVAATGFGKTIALSAVTCEILKKGSGRALIVQHRDELTRQNSDTFTTVCPEKQISFFNAEHKSWRGEVTFSMVQTLSRHLGDMPPVDLIVYDEAHHSSANSYRSITERAKELNKKVKVLGVTATPERSDNKGLKHTFTNVADIVSIGELVKSGHLVPPKAMVIDIGTQAALKGVKKTASDYDMMEVEAIQNSDINNSQVVKKWMEMAIDRQTVIFCSTIQHAEDVSAAFQEFNIESRCVHSKMSKQERRKNLDDFDAGIYPVLCNPMILTEGWDSPICSCIVLLRPSSHKSTMIQMIGRGLRKIDPVKNPGVIKKNCVILDFGISLLTHGDLEADVNLKDDGAVSGDEKQTKNCPDCGAELPIQCRECPLCGYEFKVELLDGVYNELAELSLIEIELLNKSPFKWVSLFPSDKIMIATGFDAWVSVCSPDNENWYAIGGGQGKQTQVLAIANRLGAVASADDFMRVNETSRSAKKASRWMKDQATIKQTGILAKMGYPPAMMSKVEAAANLTFQFNRSKIERLMGV